MTNDEEETSNNQNNKLLVDAISARMEQMMNAKIEALRLELQGHETDQNAIRQGRDHDRVPRRDREQARQSRDEGTDEYYSQNSRASQGSRRQRRVREERDNFSGLKLKIPPFHGKNDPDAYLEWEKKIELVFNCQHYTEINRVRVAATEFYDYALSWWDQLVTSRRRNGEFPVETWTELKTIMRKRFVPSHHHRDLHNRLRRLAQGNRSVEDYYQEMETLLIRADVSEDREATMSRFLGGLNRDIQDRLEMQHYVELEEMLHKAVLVEQQLKRKGTSRPSYGAGISSSRQSYPREERSNPFQREGKQIVGAKVEAKPYVANSENKGKAVTNTTRSRDVKCFKCQGRGHYANECTNRKTIILLENGDIELVMRTKVLNQHQKQKSVKSYQLRVSYLWLEDR